MVLQAFTLLDTAILIVLLVSLIIGLMRGFVREALSIVTWVFAIWISFKLGGDLSDALVMIKNETVRFWVGTALLFSLALIVGTLLSIFVAKVVHSTGLGGTDRTLGVLFGIGRGVLIVGLCIALISKTTWVEQDWWQKSQLAPHFKPLADWMLGFMQENKANPQVVAIKTWLVAEKH